MPATAVATDAATTQALVRDIDSVIELLFDDADDDAGGPAGAVVAADNDGRGVCSPCDSLASSFTSVASSLGAESAATDASQSDVKTHMRTRSNDSTASYLVDVDDDDNEEEADMVDDDDDAAAARAAAAQRRQRLVHAPSRVDLVHDRKRVMADRQNKLNNFILRQQQATHVSRHDHHIMLRQLIGEAYFRDPKRVEHRPRWRKILAAVRKEYWGAHAIFNLSPDPYHDVVANLSSMMLWDGAMRRWQYTYHHDGVPRRQARQAELLATLQQSGKLFLH